MRVSVRFNEKTDKDIIEYLNNCIDKTKGIKTAMRSGLIRSTSTSVPNNHQAPIQLDLIQHEDRQENVKIDVLANLKKSTKNFIK